MSLTQKHVTWIWAFPREECYSFNPSVITGGACVLWWKWGSLRGAWHKVVLNVLHVAHEGMKYCQIVYKGSCDVILLFSFHCLSGMHIIWSSSMIMRPAGNVGIKMVVNVLTLPHPPQDRPYISTSTADLQGELYTVCVCVCMLNGFRCANVLICRCAVGKYGARTAETASSGSQLLLHQAQRLLWCCCSLPWGLSHIESHAKSCQCPSWAKLIWEPSEIPLSPEGLMLEQTSELLSHASVTVNVSVIYSTIICHVSQMDFLTFTAGYAMENIDHNVSTKTIFWLLGLQSQSFEVKIRNCV